MIKEESRARRIYSTAILIFSFVALGMSTAMIGPALPDLAFKTHHSTKDYTSVFLARAFGFLIGVLIGGKFSDKKDEMAVTGMAILLCGAFLFFLGTLPTLMQVSVVILAEGFAMGILDTVGNIVALRLWPTDEHEATQKSVMQALHAGFAIGGVLCPILARPFLGEYNINGENVADVLKDGHESNVASNDVLDWEVVTPGRLDVLFKIVGGSVIACSILFLAEFVTSRRPWSRDQQEPKEAAENAALSKLQTRFSWLLFSFFVLCVGSEISFAQFIYSYAQRNLGKGFPIVFFNISLIFKLLRGR
jgi:FHS family Na+ dependent glucose MFS transporter 1